MLVTSQFQEVVSKPDSNCSLKMKKCNDVLKEPCESVTEESGKVRNSTEGVKNTRVEQTRRPGNPCFWLQYDICPSGLLTAEKMGT